MRSRRRSRTWFLLQRSPTRFCAHSIYDAVVERLLNRSWRRPGPCKPFAWESHKLVTMSQWTARIVRFDGSAACLSRCWVAVACCGSFGRSRGRFPTRPDPDRGHERLPRGVPSGVAMCARTGTVTRRIGIPTWCRSPRPAPALGGTRRVCSCRLIPSHVPLSRSRCRAGLSRRPWGFSIYLPRKERERSGWAPRRRDRSGVDGSAPTCRMRAPASRP